MASASVLETLEACEAYVDDAAQYPEQFKPGVVKRHQAQYREARATVAELIERDEALSEILSLRKSIGDDMEFADAVGPILARVGGAA